MHLSPDGSTRFVPPQPGVPMLAPDQPMWQARLTWWLLVTHWHRMQQQAALETPQMRPWRRYRMN